MSPKRRSTPDPTPSTPAADPPEGAAATGPQGSPDSSGAPDAAAGPGVTGGPDEDASGAGGADAEPAEIHDAADLDAGATDGDAAGSDLAGSDLAGSDLAGSDAAGSDAAGSDDAGSDDADADGDGGRRRAKKADGGGPPPPPERLEGAVEALLLAAGEALTAERVRDLLGLPSALHVREAVEAIRTRWKAAGLAVEIQDVAGGHRVVTRPEYAEYVRRLWRRPAADRLSATLLETLSIVAYKQPVARAEIERIRGVQCGEALRQLLERRLLKVSGRSDQPGRPLLYATTVRFLEVFGLAGLEDLPNAKDLARL